MTPPSCSKYLLLFRDSEASYHQLSADDRQKLLQDWNAWYESLTDQGKLQGGHPLETAGRVVSRSGTRTVDGPFVESTEAVGGYFLLTVADMEEAVAVAKECPSVKLGLTVEVRPVADICPSLRQPRGGMATSVVD